MLKVIAAAIKRAFKKLGSMLKRIAGSLGGSTAMTPPADMFDEEVSDEVSELQEKLDTHNAAFDPEVRGLGELVHGYAAGKPVDRASFDLSRLPDHVAMTLLTLSRDQMSRLASAGPDICGKWASGIKTGLVGVPLPKKMPFSARTPAEEQDEPLVHVPVAARPVLAPFALAA